MGRHDLFHVQFDEFRGAAHDRFATPLRLKVAKAMVPGREFRRTGTEA
jgi:hypothetical protein